MESGNFSFSLTEEGRYRLLVNAITDYAIYMLDPNGIISSWNAGAERFKGYTADEILGQHFSTFYTPEDQAAGIPEKALATAAREGSFSTEGWRVRKDGTRFWAQVFVDPIRNPDGTLVGFAKITRDLTERVQAASALRRSEEQFTRLIQSVREYAIFMLDKEGNITTWNSGAQRIKGYTADEIIGRHFSIFYSEEDRLGGVPQRNLSIARSAGHFETEGTRVRKDGTQFVASVVIDPVLDDDGSLIGFAKVTRDITERIAMQRELLAARESFLQAQKMEALGNLTGGVAHDFNNLLMAVLSSLELLEKRVREDHRALKLIDTARQGAARGASLTKRMLAFARRQDLNPTVVDIPVLVHGLMELLQRSVGPTIEIETHFPLEVEPVFVDPVQLELAILNIVVNARDAMPQGGTISMSTQVRNIGLDKAKLPATKYIALSISDTGEGMDEQTLERATDPFFTTKGVGKGSGLGLSMVQGLAEQSNGKLSIRSRKGAGTTIELLLPIATMTSKSRAVIEQQPAALAARALSVLIVDDDFLIRINTAAMLEDLGYVPIEASSAREAMECLEKQSVDVLLTDQAMPRTTGDQLIMEVRQSYPELPTILASGYAELPSGLEDVQRLQKPYTKQELAQAIQQATAI